MTVPNLRFGSNAPAGEPSLPIEAGRYRLVTYVGCPWCRRAAIARRLLGLESTIKISVAHGAGDDGFVFSHCEHGVDPELVAHSTRELYRRQDDWQVGDSTSVPVILDEADGPRHGRIVARESGDILRDLATAWAPLHAEGAPDLYPADADIRGQLDEFAPWLDENLCAPHGKLLHSDNVDDQQAAQRQIVSTLTALDDYLGSDPWVLGDGPTEADVRLFAHLVSLASFHDTQVFKVARDDAAARGLSAGEAKNAGALAVREARPPFADWPAVDRFFSRLSSDPAWLTEDEKRSLHLA